MYISFSLCKRDVLVKHRLVYFIIVLDRKLVGKCNPLMQKIVLCGVISKVTECEFRVKGQIHSVFTACLYQFCVLYLIVEDKYFTPDWTISS